MYSLPAGYAGTCDMSNIGYRKKGDNGPLYHPDRDYAYITPELMCGAIDRFVAVFEQFPEEYGWCAEQKITKEELARAALVFARAQKDFINAVDPVNSFDEALARYGFKAIRFPVRQFLFATFGFVFCAAWFKAVRDVSIIGEESPAQDGMASFVAAARKFAQQHNVPDIPNIDAEILWMQRDVLLQQVADLQAENNHLREYAATLTAPPPPSTTWLQRITALFFRKGVHAKVQDVQRPGTVCHQDQSPSG